MQFVFYDQADTPLFVRDDAESAIWSVDQFSLSLAFPFYKDKEIVRGMRVGFTDADGVFQVFEVRQAKAYEPDHYQEIEAEHIAVAELSDEFYQGEDVTDETAEDTLSPMLTNTLWEIGNVTDTGTSSLDIEMSGVWNFIKSIEKNWNVWITPRITVDSTGITGRYLDIAPADGVWRGVRLSIAKNADNVGVTYDDSEVKTALFAFGRETGDGDEKEKLTFTDTVWAATQDHPGKPAGQAYLEDPAAKALYGRNGRNRFGFYQNSDITDPVVLLEKTWESLQTQNHPKITVDCMVADLHRLGYADQDIRLHDKVLVDLPEIGKVETLDVIKLDVDLLDPTRTQPTIGAYIPNIIFIDREAGAAARGGYGRNSGQSNAEYERAEFTTEIARNEQEIRLRAYQTDLNRTDAEVLRAFTQIDLDATRIESLATGSGVMLDENGELVVDENGDPVFITDVAVNFNPATYYPAGTYIKYGGKVYRLTTDHIPGQSWDDVSATEEKFGVYSKVIQNADQILLKVDKDDVATQLAVNVGNVTIDGGDLIVDGMITSDSLATNTITVHGLIIDNGGCNLGNANVYLNGASMLLGVYNLSLTPNGNNYTLSWMDYGGTSHSVDFSRGSSGSVTLSGTWGDWDFTVTPTPLIGTPLVETFTFTPSPNTNTPLNITHFSAHKASVNITSTRNQGLWKQILIDATGEYNQGVTDGAGFDLTDVSLTAGAMGTPAAVGNYWYADVDITKACAGMTSDTETVSVNVQPAVNVGVQAGFDMCHGTIVLDPSTDQTINPSGSVTVKVKAHATPSSTEATEVASITVKANSGFSHSMTINRKAYNVQKGTYFDTRFYRRNADGTINTSAYIDVTAGHSVYTSATNVGSSGKTVYYN